MSLKSICLLGLPLVWSLSPSHAAAQSTPEARAAAQTAQAARQQAEAEAELPAPELMLEVWRVPVTRPYAVDDADMIRVGIEQEFPAPGERASLKQAAGLRAQAMKADGDARVRLVALRLAHALAEQRGAVRSHEVHLTHLQLSESTLELARARHAAGGPLADVSAAEVESARAAALVAADEARVQTSRALLQALRDVGALETVRERPELTTLRLARDAELAEARAQRSRSGWPDFRVGASYFAPTGGMTEHGFGVSLGMRLPWLWGSRTGSEQAALSRSRALEQELAAKKRDVTLEVLEAQGAVRAAQGSLVVLQQRVLPATERARQLAQAAYASGQGRLDDVLRAQAEHVETEMQVVELENELAHRSVELDFSLGRAATPAVAPEKKP